MSKLLKWLLFGLVQFHIVDEEGGGNEEETVGTQNDARLALLSRINDGLDESRAAEFDGIYGDDENAAEETAAPETVLTTADDEEEQIQAPRKFKIKVNGVEKELTEDELIARAQKVEAADTYLAEAARIKREAEQQTQQQVPPKEDHAAEQAERRRQLVRAIQMGSEDEAMAAIDELIQLQQPSVTQADVAKSIDERLTFKEAVSRFQTEYSDILSDPMLKDIALRKDQELIARGDRRGYWDRYEDIGNELRAWKEGISGKSAKAEILAPVDKQSRKSSAPKVPTVASSKTTPPKDDEEKEESTSDIIANIAKARGGPQWMRS